MIATLPTTLDIQSIGVCTPLGAGLRVNQVEIAAEAALFGETEVIGVDDLPVRASRLSWIKPEFKRTGRMAALARRALRECLAPLTRHEQITLPVFLGLPEDHTGAPVNVPFLVRRLQDVAGDHVRLDVTNDQMFASGRASFFEALAAAKRWLALGAPRALVGAVDSLCDRGSLKFQGMLNRVLGPNNHDGVIPGEGAAFALVGAAESWPDAPIQRFRLLAAAGGREERSFQQRQPNLAAGLSQVFRELRGMPEVLQQRPDILLSCQTGETFWTKEFAMAYLRNPAVMPEPMNAKYLAENLGDLGAAAGGVAMALAQGLAQPIDQPASPRRILAYGSADNGTIGACLWEGR